MPKARARAAPLRPRDPPSALRAPARTPKGTLVLPERFADLPDPPRDLVARQCVQQQQQHQHRRRAPWGAGGGKGAPSRGHTCFGLLLELSLARQSERSAEAGEGTVRYRKLPPFSSSPIAGLHHELSGRRRTSDAGRLAVDLPALNVLGSCGWRVHHEGGGETARHKGEEESESVPFVHSSMVAQWRPCDRPPGGVRAGAQRTVRPT